MINANELTYEKEQAKDIFLGFTNLYLNAAIYGLIKEEHYFIRSSFLDTMVTELMKYDFDQFGNLLYRGIAQLNDDQVAVLITNIHSFSSERLDGLIWNLANNTLQPGTFVPAAGSQVVEYEITVAIDGQTVFSNIPVNTNYYKLISGFLNGTVISPTSLLTYSNGTLTYSGGMATKAGDIIKLLFQYLY